MSHDIAFVTLGCAKNEVDTDKMRARLEAAGYTVGDDAVGSKVAVVNTCSFLVSAAEESLDTIFDLAQEREERNPGGKLIVAGCMPSRYGDELAEELEEADMFVDTGSEEGIVEAVAELIGAPAVRAGDHRGAHASSRAWAGPSAYVKISDGCDRFCSYCMIPYIRGRYSSFAADDVLAEVGELVAMGAKEVVFIGQDTGIWGHDLPGSPTLASLLRRASREFPDTWFRVLYLQPEGISDELLDAIAQSDNVCSYLDIPLQHADGNVLSRMNRSGSPESYLALLDKVRKRVPGCVLRTTLMAGFPGEDDAAFATLLDFVDEAEFDYAVVFPYSPESGSAAAAFDGQVDDGTKLDRAQALLDACDAVGHKRAALREGSIVKVLVEGYEETEVGLEAVGRWMGQAPEVDGQVHILPNSDPLPAVGEFVDVRITGTFCYDLEGERV